jgi:hypothetical protein
MKRVVLSTPFVAILLFTNISQAFSQTQTSTQPPVRDPQALTLLQASATAMGNVVPSDSTATGTITTEAGTLTENGTITILTRGTDQSSEQIQTPHGAILVYSRGQASNGAPLSGQRAMTSQSSFFPLPLIGGALNNSDSGFKYIGLETVNGSSAHHIQFWNSFASNPTGLTLSAFTTRDIWIDATSYLPLRISYVQRAAGGSAPRIAVDVFFANYQNVGGILYPFSIQKSFNGTPSATITIQQVVFNTGLPDSNFPAQ